MTSESIDDCKSDFEISVLTELLETLEEIYINTKLKIPVRDKNKLEKKAVLVIISVLLGFTVNKIANQTVKAINVPTKSE
jgi:hypothetical protein